MINNVFLNEFILDERFNLISAKKAVGTSVRTADKVAKKIDAKKRKFKKIIQGVGGRNVVRLDDTKSERAKAALERARTGKSSGDAKSLIDKSKAIDRKNYKDGKRIIGHHIKKASTW